MNQLCFLNASRHCTRECICWLSTRAGDSKMRNCYLLRSLTGLNDLLANNASQIQRLASQPPPEIS